MSWMISKAGRASKLAEVIKQKFVEAGGAPKGSAEEAAKNAMGDIAESLCKSLEGDHVVKVEASGSAWNLPDGKARSQIASFKFETMGEFVE